MSRRLLYIIIGIIVLVVLGIGTYYAVRSNNLYSPSGGSGGSTQTTTTGSVSIKDFAFTPSSITVNKGDTVTWTNNDTMIHHILADDNSFDLGSQANGQTVKFTFNQSGTFNYHCTIHPSMKGTVIVQ